MLRKVAVQGKALCGILDATMPSVRSLKRLLIEEPLIRCGLVLYANLLLLLHSTLNKRLGDSKQQSDHTAETAYCTRPVSHHSSVVPGPVISYQQQSVTELVSET